MKLADVHPDMERYLNEDCYCPYEVYEPSGFFYMLFHPDCECERIKQTEKVSLVVACQDSDEERTRPQCLFVQHDGDRVLDITRVDATPNNIDMLSMLSEGRKPEGRVFDEFNEGHTARSLAEVLSMCDMVMID